MTKYLWTYQGDYRPNENAEIYTGDRLPEPDRGFRWLPEEFGDCWIKLHRQPDLNSEGYAIMDSANGGEIECVVKNPGTHPGGKCWWLTPRLRVHCINSIERADWEDAIVDAVEDRIHRSLTSGELGELISANFWDLEFSKWMSDPSEAPEDALIKFLDLQGEDK